MPSLLLVRRKCKLRATWWTISPSSTFTVFSFLFFLFFFFLLLHTGRRAAFQTCSVCLALWPSYSLSTRSPTHSHSLTLSPTHSLTYTPYKSTPPPPTNTTATTTTNTDTAAWPLTYRWAWRIFSSLTRSSANLRTPSASFSLAWKTRQRQ
jgi:hypothetical protein